jgi:parvulin-like peptidyl-prolyl isomerase
MRSLLQSPLLPFVVNGVLLLAFGTLVPHPLCAQNASTPRIELGIIVVDSSTQAESVLERLKKGEDFSVLAKQLSIDPTSSDGGYMGPVDISALRPQLREDLKGITPGQITAALRVPSGYAILKVLLPAETSTLQNLSPAYSAFRGHGINPLSTECRR